MRPETLTAVSLIRAIRHKMLLRGPVVALLLIGALCVAVGTALGLAEFRDVGYADSAILLRIGEVVGSGKIYPDSLDRPPYFVTTYGPLTYALLAVPYRFAQGVGIAPYLFVRLSIVGSLCLCVLLVYLISRRLYRSRPIARLCALFAVSALPLASWTTQVRGDFLALALSLASLWWLLRANGRPRAIGAAICAGMALLVKQTFLAMPVAVVIWLVYRRRYQEAVLWATSVTLTVVGGYAIAWWREPLMLSHLAALRHPILEYREALDILGLAVSQPTAPFAAIGGLLVLWKLTPERLLLFIYWIVAWFVASFTLLQAGGSVNYFWEPFMVSAVLAGPGLCELQRKANRAPMLLTAMLFVLLLLAFAPKLRKELGYLRTSYAKASDYRARKGKWDSFVATVSGRRLLSTFPDVTVLSASPEIPDPFAIAMLEFRGRWNSGPVVNQIDAGIYDLIVIAPGEAFASDNYRGVRYWSGLWRAVKRNYELACVFEDMEIWLPKHTAGQILPRLSLIGCVAAARAPVTASAPN